MRGIVAASLLFFACRSSAPLALRPAPDWHAETGAGDCVRWAERSRQTGLDPVWQLRAARRWFGCLTLGSAPPDEALAKVYALAPESPYLLELIGRFLAADLVDPERTRRLAAVGQIVVRPSPAAAAAIGLGQADLARDSALRQAALRRALAADPAGARGRRAAVALAQNAPPRVAIQLLEKAIEPHRSVLASFGHGDFSGSLAAARQLLRLCEEVGDDACAERARRRVEDLAR